MGTESYAVARESTNRGGESERICFEFVEFEVVCI
jgi:hypothetical protein